MGKTDFDKLYQSLTYLVVKYNKVVAFRKEAEQKAADRGNVAAARMWRHKREGVEQVVRDIKMKCLEKLNGTRERKKQAMQLKQQMNF